MTHFCFPESSFGVTSSGLCWAEVGKKSTSTNKDTTLARSRFVFITFSLYFYIISLSSESSQSDLGPSHPGVSGFTVPVRRASWWSFLRAACLGSASRSVSCPPGAWRRAGRWGWPARRAGPGGAAANGQSVEAGWDTATSRTLSGPPGPSPAGIPRGPGQLDHMHL